MFRVFENWLNCRGGVTAVEYGILVGGIALGIALIMVALGADIASIMEALSLGNREALEDFNAE